jgi:peroxiredoxin Q/BCP
MPKKAIKPLSIGEKIPALELQATDGVFNFKNHSGKKLVLYFYPKDATPGCTLEGHEFSKLKNQFKKMNTVVYGVSRDSLASHEKFKEKQCYTVDLISDPDEVLCKTFDVIKIKNMYGKKMLGIERSTFLIGEKGELVKEWRKVKAEGHAQAVLEELKAL